MQLVRIFVPNFLGIICDKREIVYRTHRSRSNEIAKRQHYYAHRDTIHIRQLPPLMS